MIRYLVPMALLACIALVVPQNHAVSAEPEARKLFGAKKRAANLDPQPVGSYARGCLAGGAMLPVSGPAWEAMKLQRNRNWGHPMLISFLTRFANEVQQKDGWPGLLIGDLSQPRGGPMLTGHRSHQIGLDADIWFKPKPDHALSTKERNDTWSIPLASQYGREVTKHWNPGYVKILKRAASYPETARIFLHPAVKKALCEAAGEDRDWLRKIRPWWGHNFHFHVRLRCPVGVPGCKDQDPPPEGDGCGPQLADWMKKMEKAEEWVKKKPKDDKPKPRKQLRMAELPSECQGVLEAADAPVTDRSPMPPPAPARSGAVPAPAPQKRAASASTDSSLPWLKNITTPLPDRKPQ